ncbi:hypothetical protein SAMN02990966_08002 [Rhodospirillales bacterium URHD0017]|nr:hypothetical protein SAMN02990966_08002 [Rhodospirillales bacterium URHD0017]
MLDIFELGATTSDDKVTKSFFINALLDEVRTYNSISSPLNPQPKADQLLVICQLAAEYCTSKPPRFKNDKPGGGKTFRRWEAIDNLLGQVAKEVQTLGLRMLHSPRKFSSIGVNESRSYWLELVDPFHEVGFELARHFADWIKDQDAINNRTSFWDYLKRPPTVLMPEQYKVKYYPELYGEKGRLFFDGFKLVDDDSIIWSTADKRTEFSGEGWGIFVVSPDGRLFGGSHVVGEHHHSSFLGGGMVSAAGEFVVDTTGVLRFITAKSGHYTPTVDNMRRFVGKFLQVSDDTLIQPNLRKPLVYRVGDFRSNGEAATGLCREEIAAWLRERCGIAKWNDLIAVPSNPNWKPTPAPRRA